MAAERISFWEFARTSHIVGILACSQTQHDICRIPELLCELSSFRVLARLTRCVSIWHSSSWLSRWARALLRNGDVCLSGKSYLFLFYLSPGLNRTGAARIRDLGPSELADLQTFHSCWRAKVLIEETISCPLSWTKQQTYEPRNIVCI